MNCCTILPTGSLGGRHICRCLRLLPKCLYPAIVGLTHRRGCRAMEELLLVASLLSGQGGFSVLNTCMCCERTQRSLPDCEKELSVRGSWEPEIRR